MPRQALTHSLTRLPRNDRIFIPSRPEVYAYDAFAQLHYEPGALNAVLHCEQARGGLWFELNIDSFSLATLSG